MKPNKISFVKMRSYFRSLDCQAKERYRKKLEAVSLLLNDDSYNADDRFRSDMIHWPKLEYDLIFAYLTGPRTYTQEELVSWKPTIILSLQLVMWEQFDHESSAVERRKVWFRRLKWTDMKKKRSSIIIGPPRVFIIFKTVSLNPKP